MRQMAPDDPPQKGRDGRTEEDRQTWMLSSEVADQREGEGHWNRSAGQCCDERGPRHPEKPSHAGNDLGHQW